MTKVRTGLIAMLAAALAACTVGPTYERPDVDAGAGWIAPLEAAEADVDLARWWQSFDRGGAALDGSDQASSAAGQGAAP